MNRLIFTVALLILLCAICIACTDPSSQSDASENAESSRSADVKSSESRESSAPTETSLISTVPVIAGTETTLPITTAEPTAMPVTTVSVTTAPATTEPATTVPATTVPVTTVPVTTVPVTTVPVTTVPVTTVPVTTTEPVTVRPSTLVTPVTEPSKDELVKVIDYIPSIYVDLRYAGSDNLAGTPIYSYSDAYLRYGTVRRLAAVQEDLLKEGYSLLIWDAYRPLSAQLTLSTVLPAKGTSPVVKRVPYNSGDTLSVSIVKADGSPVALPYDFDCNELTDTHDHSAQAASNVKHLANAMYAHGFTSYLSQWYRFTDKDEYLINETLTIGEHGIESSPEWVTVCDTALSLRAMPYFDAEILTRLPRNHKVRLIFFQADFAYVEADGQYGYVLAAYLSRSLDGLYQPELAVVEPCETYSYGQMQSDLKALAEKFPDQLRISSIGESEEGRDLTLAIVGNENAEKKVFLQSTIHAREFIVTELTVAQIDYMLHHQDEQIPNGQMTIGELFERVCFHIVPMSNPDGVHIVQTGTVPERFAGTPSANLASLWKANANGVDLNANFDADWEDYGNGHSTPNPGYMSYKGTAPECAAESKALADYLRANRFDLILSYHTSGSVIYYTYGGEECAAVNAKNYDLSCRLAVISSFTLNGQASSSTAGLKDWAIQTLKTPSLTIEFAAWNSPIMLREFDQIWARSRDMLSVCGEWVLDQ